MNSLNFLIVILVLIVLVRTIEVILFDKNKKQGEIYEGWTLAIFVVNYGFLVLSTIFEYVLIRRQIILFVSGIALGIMIIRFSI